MTSQIVQSTAKQLVSPGGSVTFSLTGVAAGNALVITLQYGGSSSNIAGATYPTGWTAQSVKASSGGGRADVAFITNVAGGTESVTVSAAAGTYFTGEMHEVAGLAASPLDLVLTVTGGGTTLTPTAANHTTAQASEIIFSVVGYDPYNTGGTLGSTPPTGYTSLWQETDGNANAAGAGAYKVLSAITTVADTWTGLTATYNYAISVSLKLGGSAPTSATTTESASGADASSVTVITSATQAENASASDLETTGNAEARSIPEAASGADVVAQSSQTSSATAESASAADTVTTAGGVTPTLVAHTMKVDYEGTGVSPLSTSPINVPQGATILIHAGTQPAGVVASIADSSSNTIQQVGTNETFLAGGGGTLMWKVVNAKADAAYVVTITKTAGYQTDETTIDVMVFSGSSGVGAFNYSNNSDASGTPLTTTGNNSVVAAFWDSDDYNASNTYGVNAPYTLVDSDGAAANSICGADAYTTVANSGTATAPTFTATSTLTGAGALWLVEVLAGQGTSEAVSDTEPATAADATSSTASTGTAQAESASGVDASATTSAVTAADSESASAADSSNGAAETTASQTDSSTAVDSPAQTSSTATAQADNASALDATTQSSVTTAAEAEAASAADGASTGNAEAASLAEAGSAADIAATLILAISQIAESATAAVVAAAQSNTVAVLQEPASASDAQAASQAGVSSVAEQGAAADAPASAEQVGASTAEAGSAGDQPSSGNVLPAASAESGAAADSLSATVAFLSAAQEIASATDALAYAASTITDAAEAAHAADLVATLAQLSQSITEAALAQDTTSLIQTLAEIAEWQYVATQAARSWAVSMPGRSFYAGAAFRSFYILATSNMAMQFPSAIDPGDVKVLTLDATADLPAGVTLTGAPTVEVVVTRGTDANAGAHFTQPTINTTPVTVTTPTGTTTIAVGLCVQLVAAGCLDGCWYEIRVTCQTTQANNIEVLKGVLTCTAS